MPYITINDANIYYETYGDEGPGRAPIVLIHGSTIDSHTDWDSVAPALARHYKVYAPDCRGHGKSNNPNMSYSFKELADDVATFVRAMGYEKAHIIGHSNGGNVAMVVGVEHPEVTQTEVNGSEYWKDLLWLTMKEIISEPNYSPGDLARVNMPMLVIMGAEDTVNAPDEHAQYIAKYVPNAQLWIPEKTGHNVHKEREQEWVEKVLEFLKDKG